MNKKLCRIPNALKLPTANLSSTRWKKDETTWKSSSPLRNGLHPAPHTPIAGLAVDQTPMQIEPPRRLQPPPAETKWRSRKIYDDLRTVPFSGKYRPIASIAKVHKENRRKPRNLPYLCSSFLVSSLCFSTQRSRQVTSGCGGPRSPTNKSFSECVLRYSAC